MTLSLKENKKSNLTYTTLPNLFYVVFYVSQTYVCLARAMFCLKSNHQVQSNTQTTVNSYVISQWCSKAILNSPLSVVDNLF